MLTAEEVSRLIHAPVKGPAGRLAVLLGVLCGMRRGEVRGLQWGDIGKYFFIVPVLRPAPVGSQA